MSEALAKACVIGWPISHSRSPLIHTYWLRQNGIAGTYEPVPVRPEEIDGFLAALPGSGFLGCNVTLPHKEAAFRNLAHPTPVARALKAANTIWLKDGELIGDNTDVHGFLANLDSTAPGWADVSSALIIGAGGSARAIAHGLVSRGLPRIRVLNRTPSRAQKLADDLNGPLQPGSLEHLQEAIADAGLIVNTTSAGLSGAPPLIVDWSLAKPGAIVTDLVYVPLNTPFLAGAAAAGLRTVDGLGMLLHQAAPGFEQWFKRPAIVDDTLRQLVLRDIQRADQN